MRQLKTFTGNCSNGHTMALNGYINPINYKCHQCGEIIDFGQFAYDGKENTLRGIQKQTNTTVSFDIEDIKSALWNITTLEGGTTVYTDSITPIDSYTDYVYENELYASYYDGNQKTHVYLRKETMTWPLTSVK